MTNETLYNGIILPETWPPRHVVEASREPIPVPYLANPPEIIPIDLGRQLFVDDFLIAETTLTRAFGKPEIHEQSPVLQPETEEEMDFGNCPMAAPFNDGVWYDPQERLFKMWYMPGWFHSTALATSADGIHWERPQFDVVPETNLVWPNRDGYDRDGCLVWLDSSNQDAMERFKMFQYYRHYKPTPGQPPSHPAVGRLKWARRRSFPKAGPRFRRTASTGAIRSSPRKSATTPPSSITPSAGNGV